MNLNDVTSLLKTNAGRNFSSSATSMTTIDSLYRTQITRLQSPLRAVVETVNPLSTCLSYTVIIIVIAAAVLNKSVVRVRTEATIL